MATVVALRGERVLLVRQPAGGWALPGGKRRAGESPAAAAARELAEETGIAVPGERLVELELRIEAGPFALRPFLLDDPPRPSSPAELQRRWVPGERIGRRALLPGVARSVHAGLARRALAARAEDPPVRALVQWWVAHGRDLPWRATRDPYGVLVAEVMSHQTQVGRAAEYWLRWMARWPTVQALAEAPLAEVLGAWDGLGYPRRARDLHRAAQRIRAGGWPPAERLAELPGVGPYTAAAVRCFAYEEPVLPRDANVNRVLARRFPGGLRTDGDAWRLGQAVMELGQRVCSARPACPSCPLRDGCLVRRRGRLGSGAATAAPGAVRRIAARASRPAAARRAERTGRDRARGPGRRSLARTRRAAVRAQRQPFSHAS